MMRRLRRYLELVAFEHTLFALPFALAGAILGARGAPAAATLGWVLVAVVGLRTAAMAFNRLVDRRLDAENPRTAGRHLPAGVLSAAAVSTLTLLCSGTFVAATLLFLPNIWPVILSLPVLLFLFGYSYAKRWTKWCHYWLAAALMLSPLAVWIALAGTLAWPPVLLAAVILFWVGGFDIIYACQDAEFDRRHGLHSLPARWGIPAALRLAFVSHLLTIAALVALWWVADLGVVFLLGIIGIAALLLYEHRLVRPDNLARVNVAFFTVNAVISIGLLVIGLLDLWMA
jgi:4-hydroxybenzoate polyprenyltransferase